MARPEKWKDEYLRIIERACKLGATDIEVADMLDISVRTLNYWKTERPELIAAMVCAKEEADQRVVRSLYERASGYERDEVDIRVIDGQIVQTTIRKFYPPDATSMIFWLKNRRPSEWRDKQDHEHSGSVNLSLMQADAGL